MIKNTPIAGKRVSSQTTSAILHSLQEVREGSFSDLRLSPQVQKVRIARVMENELTEKQRNCVARAMRGLSLSQIAREDGVSLSTVSRTFHRGMRRLRRFLRY